MAIKLTNGPETKCAICHTTAKRLISEWNSAPCLHSLDEGDPKCLSWFLHMKNGNPSLRSDLYEKKDQA